MSCLRVKNAQKAIQSARVQDDRKSRLQRFIDRVKKLLGVE